MKPLSLLALAMLATITSAQADFRPGRVRPGTFSEMTAVKATGYYEGTRGAVVSLNYQDGVSEPVSLSVKIDGGRQVTYPIESLRPSFCGDRYVAAPKFQSNYRMTVELVDYRRASCEIALNHLWHVSVTLSSPDNTDGQLTLVGNPEELAVTL